MMKKLKTESGKWKMIILLLCGLTLTGTAQNKNTPFTKEELANYELEINRMVHYLQETLNFIGDPSQTTQEKEIIFTQSYSKIFFDDKVQIEDDLDIKRSTSLCKDVQAYLKDIDFFFQYAQFTFDVQSIANLTKPDGSPYFKVSMNRHLVGKTVTNDSINEVINRYIEINLDKKNNDLKIVSIYTTRINERQTLSYWWNSMPSAWKNYFGEAIMVNDSVPLKSVVQVNEKDFIYSFPVLTNVDGETIVTDWKEINVKTGIDTLYQKLKTLSLTQAVDVTDIKTITTLEPLSELSNLQTLNVSGTNINDLSPLRNANKLKVLKAANTHITDLTPLKYDLMIQELDIARTDVDDLTVLEILKNLEKLNVSYTKINKLKSLENCSNLTHLTLEGSKITHIQPLSKLENIVALDISNTAVKDLSPVSSLKALQSLKISKTNISNLNALSEMENLKELYCSNTNISDLTPLKSHRRLSKIYCDNTRIDINQASDFSKTNPFTLVIYDTKALEQWWDNLPIYWKAVFSKQVHLSGEPSTEQLHEVINMTDLDLSGNEYMQNLIPVSRLTNLVNLNISNTEITRLDPLFGMTNIEHLNLSNTYINDLSPLSTMGSLKTLDISNTPIEDLTPLVENNHLELIMANNTNIKLRNVIPLKEKVPNVIVIFQTEELKNWWENLDDTWKSIFKAHIASDSDQLSPIELQRIIDLRAISVDQENTITSLDPIRSLYWIEKLSIISQGIRDIRPLYNKTYLSEVLMQNNPISDLSPLENDTLLTILNIENTQVSDLSKLEKLPHLRVLNASGTGIKSLKPLAKMNELEELLINNTSVKSISPIENIPSLKLLKIYNTRVKTKTVNALQQKRFDLNIVYY